MSKIVRRNLWVFLIILLITGMINPQQVLAASANVELSADSTEVTVGDEFFLYVTVSSQTEFGDFEGSITYDESVLEYQGGASQIKGSDGYLTISDRDNTDGDTKRKYTMKFEASQVGICKIEFSDRAIVYELSGDEMSVSSNTLSINVTAPVTASSNARLKDLKINPSVLSPEFKAETFEYSTEVDYLTDKLVIVAIPEDEKSKVSITGNEALAEGENIIVISVLAESGDVIEYSIKARKEATPEASVTPGGDVVRDHIHGNFEVKKIEGDKFAVYSGQYKLLEPGSDVIIPTGYVETRMILSDISVTAFYPEGNMESNYLLIYAENEIGEVGFYRYDKIERSMQRYEPTTDIVVKPESEVNTEDLITSEEYRSNLTKAAIVIAVLSGLCALLVVLCIRFFIKSRGYKEDDLD